jgi:hypothetical protein
MCPESTAIETLLSRCTKQQRLEIFKKLRVEFPIHAIEQELNIEAEIILEAISRAADLTLRGIRGIIAEAAFKTRVLPNLPQWEEMPIQGQEPFDYLLRDAIGSVRVQVKMQRLKAHRPMIAREGYRTLPDNMYVVETQKTRGGKDAQGRDTRPYKFGQFDILAVSLHPSTNDWSQFRYTVADWLLARKDNDQLMLKFQPVASAPNHDWTDQFEVCVNWLRARQRKRIYPGDSRTAA